MCLGMFMAILDIQVVATSLPSIQQALVISPDQMSWIQTAYLIAEVIAIPLTGSFTRVLTLRWLFALATLIFTLASLGCAFSGNFTSLVIFRIIQGFAGGTLIPSLVFPDLQEGRYELSEKGSTAVRQTVDVRGGEVTTVSWPT